MSLTLAPEDIVANLTADATGRYDTGRAYGLMLKSAERPVAAPVLSGRLVASDSGWLLLTVPNALVRGLFDAMDEPGIELPLKDGRLTAHISVMRKEEVAKLGGPDKISERGHFFSYQLGPMKTVEPKGWPEMSKVWFVEVQSPALRALRKSYGLSPLPNGDHEFHITIAVRRRHVLRDNDISKAAGTGESQNPETEGAQHAGSDQGLRDERPSPHGQAPAFLARLRDAAPLASPGRVGALAGRMLSKHADRGRTSTNTSTLPDGRVLDIDMLISRAKGRKVEAVPTGDIPRPSRSSATGFSKKRLANVDMSEPILVGVDGTLHDGRHRLLRHLAEGHEHVPVRRVTPVDLRAVTIRSEGKPSGDKIDASRIGLLPIKRGDFASEHGTGGPPRDDWAQREYFRRLFLSRVTDDGGGNGRERPAEVDDPGAGRRSVAPAEANTGPADRVLRLRDDRDAAGDGPGDGSGRASRGRELLGTRRELDRIQSRDEYDTPRVVAEIRRAIRGLPPLMPGYGDVYYNPEERKVYVVCGDGDERDVIAAWRRRLTSIDGVDTYDGDSEHVRAEVGTMAAAKPPWIKVAGLKAREPRLETKVFTVAVDLDGTIYAYDTWKGEDHFGKLRPGVLKALREFQRRGWRIIIFTTRGNTTKVKQQLNADDVPFDYINENPDQPDGTSSKVIADVYIDDRAVDASMAWERVVDAVDRKFRKAAAAPLPSLIDAIVAEELKQDAAVPPPPRKYALPALITRSNLFDPSPEVFNDATMNALVHEQMLPDGDPFPLPEVPEEKSAAILPNNAAMITALLPNRAPLQRRPVPARRRSSRRPALDLLAAQQEAADVDALIPMLRARRARMGSLLKQALGPVDTGTLIGAGVGGLGGYMLGRKTKHPWLATLAGAGVGAGVGGLGGAYLGFVPETSTSEVVHGPSSTPVPPTPANPGLPATGSQSLERNISRWYADAPGGVEGAVDRALAARAPVPGVGTPGFSAADIRTPVPIAPMPTSLPVSSGKVEGLSGVNRPWFGRPHAQVYLDTAADKVQQNKEHELSHTAFEHLPSLRGVPNLGRSNMSMSYSEYVDDPSELMVRLADIKRRFAYAHPGRDITTPEAAGEALEWWRDVMRNPEFARHVADPAHSASWYDWERRHADDPSFWDKLKRLMPQLVMGGGPSETAKMAAADFAPGLPRKNAYGDLSKLTPGQLLTYVLQHHRAYKAGPHHDLRIGSPELGLYSWAVPRGLPPPGGRNLAIHQPVHRHRYRKFEGEIPRGQYGAGTVKKVDEGQVLITKAGPDHIHFTLAHRRHPERYTLLRPKGFGRPRDWLLVNTTPVDKVPFEKLHYKRIPSDQIEEAIRKMGAGGSVEAKVDGASQLVHLLKGHAEHFSYRTSKETGRPIPHTERVFGGRPEIKYPPHLEGSILKGELHAGPISARPDDRRHDGVGPGTGAGDAGHRSGSFGPQDIATLLNSSIAHSLQLQRDQGVKIRNMLYDVGRYGRRPVGPEVPRSERREMLGEFMKHLPADTFHLSEPVHTPAEGIEMFHQIRSGKHPLTQEGVVIHPAQGVPLKGKLTDEHLVHVTGTFPGEGKRSRTVGGFTYGHEPGKTVGRVGSGFSDQFLNEVARDPAVFVGRLARIKAQEKLPSGALRAPVFLGLHEDYNTRPAKVAGTDETRARALSRIRPDGKPSWVQHVMAHYDSTKPPPGIFTRGADEIVAAGRDPHVAPLGPASWQKMVVFHRNRGGHRLGEERRDVLQEAIGRLSEEIRSGREKTADLLSGVQLQPQQRRVAERVNAYDPRVLVYHGLGSGKSLASIAAAERSGRPYVAAVPAALRPNYHKELAKFTDLHTPTSVLSYTQVGQGKQPLANPDTLILDEAQRLRNPNSAATRGITDLATRAKRVLMLSGTPIVNNPSDLAVPLSILTGTQVTPAEFNKRFVGEHEVSPGFLARLRGIKPTAVPTIAHEQELEDLLRGHVDYHPSRTPEGVRTNEERVVVDMSPAQKDFYRLMWNQLPWTTRWKMQHDYPMTKQELQNLQAFMTGPRQAALSLYPFRGNKDALRAFHDSAKLRRAFDDAHAILGKDPRAKVIAYSNFIDAGLTPYAAALKAHGVPYSILHGKLNDVERKAQLDAYNQGKSRVLLIGPSAAEGISAQGTQLIQLLDPHWNEARMGQAQGRGLRFDSHKGLPEELRDVAIRRYISRMPDPGFFGRLFGGGQRPTADEFLESQARRKEELNDQFRTVLRRVGSEPPTRPWWSLFG